MQRTIVGNKGNLFLLIEIVFFGSWIVIEPSAIAITIELLSGCKFIYIWLFGLVVEFIIYYGCGVFVVLPSNFLIKCIELFLIRSAPAKSVIILRSFAVIHSILVVVLPIAHLWAVLPKRLISHMAHEIIQIILVISDFICLFKTDLLNWRYTLLLGSTGHLLYFWFEYPLTLLWFNYLHLLASSFGFLVCRLVVLMFVGSDVVQGQADCIFDGSVVCAESE
jgi:hypothetical protein